MTGLDDLVAGAARVLWVENDAVRDLLAAAWNCEGIRVLSAGSAALVPLLASVAPPHVFGAVGRGFGSDNRHRWQRPPADLRTYVAPVFDLDCWRVGPDARPPDDATCARMAGRHLLADTARAARAGLPDEGDLDAILASGWFTTVAADLPTLADPAWVHQEHARLVADYQASRRNRRWRAVFPGSVLLAGGAGGTGEFTADMNALRDSLLSRIP